MTHILYICHDEFALVNNMLREYNDMKKENEKLNTAAVHKRFWFNLYNNVTVDKKL